METKTTPELDELEAFAVTLSRFATQHGFDLDSYVIGGKIAGAYVCIDPVRGFMRTNELLAPVGHQRTLAERFEEIADHLRGCECCFLLFASHVNQRNGARSKRISATSRHMLYGLWGFSGFKLDPYNHQWCVNVIKGAIPEVAKAAHALGSIMDWTACRDPHRMLIDTASINATEKELYRLPEEIHWYLKGMMGTRGESMRKLERIREQTWECRHCRCMTAFDDRYDEAMAFAMQVAQTALAVRKERKTRTA